jgi:hypothetical protein
MPRILWTKSRLVPGDLEKRIYAEEIHEQMDFGSFGQLAGKGLDELPFKPVNRYNFWPFNTSIGYSCDVVPSFSINLQLCRSCRTFNYDSRFGIVEERIFVHRGLCAVASFPNFFQPLSCMEKA